MTTRFPLSWCMVLGLLLVGSGQLHAQSEVTEPNTKTIEILSADALKSSEVNGLKSNMLVGNVKLKQGDVILTCDSSRFYISVNRVDAFGHVHIQQGDTMNIYSDSLKYDGATKLADFYGNVRMIQGSSTLTTKHLTYSTASKIANYFGGGHLVNPTTDLVSDKGYYYSDSKTAFFKTGVVVKSKEYTLYSDTMSYNQATEISRFYGPTRIVSDSTTIYCERGWSNAKTDVSSFGKGTVMYSPPQTLWTDSLYYERKTGIGKTYKKFTWKDSSMNVIMSGRRADFQQKEEHVVATDHALLINIMDSDSLYLTADTLVSMVMRDSCDTIRNLYAYHHVKIYKTDIQGLCDSLWFGFKDSTMWMYRNPVLWNEANQLTGDTITMTMRNQKIDHLDLFKNGYIINEADTGLYNQIKGKHVTGYFDDGKLRSMYAQGNGESLYYGKDDSGGYMGINKATCANIWIYMDTAGINKVKFIGTPVAVFIPIQKTVISEQKLKGFAWRQHFRPLSKEEVIPCDDEPDPAWIAQQVLWWFKV